ncbi:hypothetical protein [Pseudomonas mangrovi]|uniref:Glycosyltransferase RgtA/B/C/D-like domain-containing protein n=1 Tax=Pseudomonas mangrovi TaxID=2161748 RepID=A0A2T5PFI5_9PSED|nr:hypothetical protein [Pseudomonas mangrovi]PTU76493.1 hypothetical protein DBO85_02325 [Pseudomonas mangrovi]
MQTIFSRLERVSPVWLAFFGSLLLSIIAVSGEATIGKDAAFYIDIAQRVDAEGAKTAIQFFNWPWFPILLAWTHSLLGLSYELTAYFWCGLLMAGSSALLLACLQRSMPERRWWLLLLVLAVPAMNAFRNDILREQGFWFFSALALWLALAWDRRGGWWLAAGIHLAILGAALFRLEALMLLGALAVWRLPDLFSRAGMLRLLQLALLPLVALLFAVLALGVAGEFSQGRVEYYLQMLDPSAVRMAFQGKADALAQGVFAQYMDDEAGPLLLGVILLAVLLTFIKLCGPLALVFLQRHAWGALARFWREYRLFAWAALIYLAVLVVFFLQQGFVNSRYVSYLNLLLLPLLAFAMIDFVGRFPRLGKVLAVLLVLQMFDNVISLSARKTHYVDAGQWMSQYVAPSARIYYDDPRIGYYAGFGYRALGPSLQQALEQPDAFDYLLIEADGDEPWLLEWLEQHDRRVLARFANRKDDAVLVIGR